MFNFKGSIAVHAITWGEDHFKALEEASKLGYRAIEPWASFVLSYEDRMEGIQGDFGTARSCDDGPLRRSFRRDELEICEF